MVATIAIGCASWWKPRYSRRIHSFSIVWREIEYVNAASSFALGRSPFWSR